MRCFLAISKVDLWSLKENLVGEEVSILWEGNHENPSDPTPQDENTWDGKFV